ncbi:FKBP-type peptidyl-prolyl cis-trans isomerase [Albibacterium profundi]|uniref:Peptidyl-prolyl cis-trans isomerase n=1 Tax=Albibacterium profundi TaxID=3134906 RepID=A0ABV5CER1_9SPHI
MNILNSRFFLFCLFGVLALASCEKKEYQTIVELDEENIQEYIRKNNLSEVVPFENTGMYYQIIEDGDGAPLDYDKKIPIVYSFVTHDGSYSAIDTFKASNRYADYLGYFPYGSAAANSGSGSPLDKEEGLKRVIHEVLKNAGGKIRVLVPSRLAYGRNGSKQIGSNMSLDYTIHAIDPDNLVEYESYVIEKYIPSIGGMQLGDFEKTETGIYYNILEPGTGDIISENSTVKLAYSLRLLNGNILEESATDSTSLSLANTIEGWQEILPKLRAGGKVRMVLPSSQGYGTAGNVSSSNANGIPPFSPLDFEVKIKSATN